MEKKIDDICRLCLKFEGTDFLSLDEYRITKLKVIIPDLDIDHNQSGHFMMCMKCKEALDNGYTLTRTIVDNQVLINTRKSKLNIEEKVVLDRLFNDKESGEPENNICRICLNMSTDTNSLFLDTLPEDDSFQDVLRTCFSNLDRELVANPLVCSDCIDKAYEMYGLISGALVIDEKIKQFCESDPNNKNLDLNQVLLMLGKTSETEEGGENDFLSEFEVKDEEEMDIFDSIPVDNESSAAADGVPKSAQNNGNDHSTTRKRPAGTPTDTLPAKQRRNYEPNPDDLPVFKFSLNLMYDVAPQNGIGLSDWLNAVDEQKKKQGWSDNMTVQKVLLKLQSLPDLHSWFCSMADIMTWDEWKIRLVKAFPPLEDFNVILKRAVNRKKRSNETFVDYLQQKTALLEKVNITGTNAVSCVIASLTYSDLRISCIARMGNYQSPQDLMEYFKKCDEKESLSGKEASNASTPQSPEKSNESKAVTKPESTQAKKKSVPAAKKKVKKCFKCLSIGHNTMNCPNKPPGSAHSQGQHGLPNKLNFVPPKPLQAKSNASPSKKKKRNPLCKFCGKFGHLISVCSRYKQKQLDSKARSAQLQETPKCSHCGDPGHVSFNCPRSPKVVPTPLFERRSTAQCGFCQRKGHTTDKCHIANRKAERNAKQEAARLGQAAMPVSQQDLSCSHCGSTRHPTRHCGRAQQSAQAPEQADRRESCRICGSKNHPSSACYYSSKPESDQRRQNQSSEQHLGPAHALRDRRYTPMLCTKCYKLGHKTEDCSRYNSYHQ